MAPPNRQLKTDLSIRPTLHPFRPGERDQDGRNFRTIWLARPTPQAPAQLACVGNNTTPRPLSEGRRVAGIKKYSDRKCILAGENIFEGGPGRAGGPHSSTTARSRFAPSFLHPGRWIVPRCPLGKLAERHRPGRRMLKLACFRGLAFQPWGCRLPCVARASGEIVPEIKAERFAERCGLDLGLDSTSS